MQKVLFEGNISAQFDTLDENYTIVESGTGVINTDSSFTYVNRGSTIYEPNKYQYPGSIEITLTQENCGINGNWHATLINELTGLTVYNGTLSNFVLQVDNLDSYSSYTVILKDLDKEYNSLCRTNIYPNPSEGLYDAIESNLKILEVPLHYYDIAGLDYLKNYYFVLLTGNGFLFNLNFKLNGNVIPTLRSIDSGNAWSLDDFEPYNKEEFYNDEIYLVENEFVKYFDGKILRGMFDTPPMQHQATSKFIYIDNALLESIIVEADSGAQYNLTGTVGKNITYTVSSFSDTIIDRKNKPDTMCGVKLNSYRVNTYTNGILGDANISGGIRLIDDIWGVVDYDYNNFDENLLGKIEVIDSNGIIVSHNDSFRANIYNSTLSNGTYHIKCYLYDSNTLLDSMYPFEFDLEIINELWSPSRYANLIIDLNKDSEYHMISTNVLYVATNSGITFNGNGSLYNGNTYAGPTIVGLPKFPLFNNNSILITEETNLYQCINGINLFMVLDITSSTSSETRLIEINEDSVGSHFNISTTINKKILLGYRNNSSSNYKYIISDNVLNDGEHMIFAQLDYFTGKIDVYVDGEIFIDHRIQDQIFSFHYSSQDLRTIIFGNDNDSSMKLYDLKIGSNTLISESIDLYFGCMSSEYNLKNLLQSYHPYKISQHYSLSGYRSYNLNGYIT